MPASTTHTAARNPAPAASRRVALEWWAVAALVAVFVAGVAWVASEPTPLGHDESVYALWARHWLEGTPATGVSAHRAPGVPAVLALVQALGLDGEPALRVVGVAAGGALVAATWTLGRIMAGPVPGLVAAGVVASSPRVIDESARALTDVPAAALVVALTALGWWQLERPSCRSPPPGRHTGATSSCHTHRYHPDARAPTRGSSSARCPTTTSRAPNTTPGRSPPRLRRTPSA